MFTTLLVIATTALAAVLGAVVGFGLGHLAVRPTLRRLRTELADAARQLTHDPLTGLLNRTGLRAVHTTIAASGDPQPIIVILIDLDHFKQVNDTYSHDAGDDLLTQTADRLGRLAATYGGSVARLSGDEFAAILPVRHHGITDIADRFTTAIAEPVHIDTDHGPTTVTVTASLGIAVADSTEPLEDVALHRADIAMYHAKRHGGDRHVLQLPGMTMPDREHRRGPRLRDLHRDQRGSAA
ncbi:GGDEF domain-containing protein [Micromonospora echinofusca]|uniref:Diguanylate cyclase n=1 Tax=Micromonospora echinofusca TaxID=47858 RepID=A0ABS3VZ11_MICEH|nr:GGDEF domain-containing protein [Micromonospora echinofusca]MBO4209791.1 diguanylate cyclase [Micromonospora echinofusca]